MTSALGASSRPFRTLGGIAEGATFLALAIAVHLLLVAQTQDEGTARSGAAGAVGKSGAVALAGATSATAALIEAWETAPEAMPAPEAQPPADPAARPEIAEAQDDVPIRASAVQPRAAERPQGEAVRPEIAALPFVAAAPPPLLTPVETAAPQLDRLVSDAPIQTRQIDAARLSEVAPITPPPEPPVPDAPPSRLAAERAPPPPTRPDQRRRQPVQPHRTARPSVEPTTETQDAAAAPGAASNASGEGTSESAGLTSGVSDVEYTSLMRAYGAEVLAAIARKKRYPRRARVRNQEGVARLTVTIDRAGRLVAARIVGASGHAMLDEAALAAADAVGRFPRPPDALSGQRFSFTIPIRFSMR